MALSRSRQPWRISLSSLAFQGCQLGRAERGIDCQKEAWYANQATTAIPALIGVFFALARNDRQLQKSQAGPASSSEQTSAKVPRRWVAIRAFLTDTH
jgi:hypothetical protein